MVFIINVFLLISWTVFICLNVQNWKKGHPCNAVSVMSFITTISSENILKNSDFIRKFRSLHVRKLYESIFDKPEH